MTKVSKSKQYKPPGKRKVGTIAKYTTRNKALNRLQIKLPEFRRLCILKGIHPREPKKKVEGHNKTYYHVKDIQFLAHEPLLEKSRELKAYEKKIKKARAKRNEDLAERLVKNRPSFSLDHLVKERYPSFVDALRDLDDPLTMLHVFAVLPADNVHKIPVERIHTARRLTLEWQAYITRSHALRKCFVSVKGVYYQAEVGGQKITWLTPHVLSQVLPPDVDFRVMLTFVEFYETLVGFVNFKLYHELGLQYPPVLDQNLEKAAADLYGVMRDLASADTAKAEVEQENLSVVQSQARLASLQSRLKEIEKERDEAMGDATTPGDSDRGQEAEEEDDLDTKECRQLFKELKFFLGREVPRESLLFVIRAFGGVVSWDGEGAPYDEFDESITHQIVDRPTQGHKFLSRDYLQPQWVYDCINNRVLVPTDGYVLGRIPPPHLSPFVDNDAEGYMPEYAETMKRLQVAASNDLPVKVLKTEEAFSLQHTQNVEGPGKEREASATEQAYVEDLSKEIAGIPYSSSLNNREQDGSGDESMEEETTRLGLSEGSNIDRVKAVLDKGQKLRGRGLDTKPVGSTTSTASEIIPEADEAVKLGRMMMTRKDRGLYDAAKMGNAKKKAATAQLKERKRKADEAKRSR